mgnify:CR=1 FL=1
MYNLRKRLKYGGSGGRYQQQFNRHGDEDEDVKVESKSRNAYDDNK